MLKSFIKGKQVTITEVDEFMTLVDIREKMTLVCDIIVNFFGRSLL